MRQETLDMVRGLVRAAVADAEERAELLAMLSPPRGDKLITTRRAMEISGRSRKTLRSWELSGLLHPVRLSPIRIRFKEDEVRAAAEEMAT